VSHGAEEGSGTFTSGQPESYSIFPLALLPGMNHEDVKAELTIDKVVFDDNTIWSANGH
jgi:hypothetical protein